jgi:hypothetical protein
MAAPDPQSASREQYVGVAADGSPPASPKLAHPLKPPSPTLSDEFSEAQLASAGPLEKPWARLGKVALLVAVPAVVLLVAFAGLLTAVGHSGSAGILFGSAPDYDVLVIGAGTAGLAAAKQLRTQGGLKVMPAFMLHCRCPSWLCM